MIKDYLYNFHILNRKNWKKVFFLFFLMFLTACFDVLSIAIIFPLVNMLLDVNNTDLNFLKYDFIKDFVKSDNALLVFSVFIIVLVALKNVFLFFYQKISSNYFSYLTVYHQEQLLRNYTLQEYSYFLNKKSSQFIREFQSEIKMLNTSFIQPLIIIFFDITTIIFFLFFLFFVNPYLTFSIILISLGFVVTFIMIYKKKFIDFGIIRRNTNFKFTSIIKQIFDGIRELKIYNKETIFFLSLKKSLFKLANMNVSRSLLSLIPKLIIETLLVFFFVLSILISQDPKLLIATLSVFAASAFRVIPRLNSLTKAFQQLNFSKTVLNDLIKIFDAGDKIEKNLIDENIKYEKNIEIKNLTFSYDKNFILNDVNLTIKKNTIVGLRGDSGSGKSTFVDLFSCLLKPASGKIYVDSIEINESRIKAWKNKISYIQQTPFIFDESIYFNVSMESESQKVNYKRVNEILKLVNLDNLKNKEFGELGSNISGGQAQRLAIARALYNHCEILIFDESLNSLDEKNKNEILDLIYILRKNHTIIIISHDNNVLKNCDYLYEINNKKILKV